MSQDCEHVLGDDGPLARALEDFHPRQAQQDMAQAVAEAMQAQAALVVEAGTGVGKTFGYLVPALLDGGKVIISTGTRNLQDQLYHKDLPLVAGALGVSPRTALLKGRSNYLCPHRLNMTLAEGRMLEPRLVEPLRRVQAWADKTRHGDIAELTDLGEDAEIWPRVTSTVDNCLGQDCPEYAACHVVQARRRAQEAEVVVVNHHLLFADLALRGEGFGELLPSANAFVLDEAHQLPDVAGNFFGVTVSARALTDLARDSIAELLNNAPDMGELRDRSDALTQAVKAFRLALGEGSGRGPWVSLATKPAVEQGLDDLENRLTSLADGLEAVAERAKGLESCGRRAREQLERLSLFRGPQDNAVQWYEAWTRSFSLHVTPLDVAALFKEHRGSYQSAWIFTSATLSVDGAFDHFNRRMGLEDPRCLLLDSPFDYQTHARLFLPPRLPEPNDGRFTGALVDMALPLIRDNPGGTFMLFTSLKALREAAQRLRDSLDRPLLVQGEASRNVLLERFREAGNGVLLGSHSFWEGVDVRGTALTCVIIDRLPFAAPGDPVLEARIARIRQGGGNPFRDLQLPQAVISLKQGAGRLIRDISDQGVLVLCDPRIRSKSYGKTFIKSLPPMQPVTDDRDVIQFLRSGPSLQTSHERAPQ
ncbi:ATP-dependent DNA helicase [Ectothiorhodospira variabilis]|uniref:ATP-dependent DNA helicase n=1 Tax=Ectothiorhodospira variabilis TaxID=505694 RepID=UPI001EFC16B2|nr:ATP-dependent DNA helicase [Ectothiorhodospira variabilis]MCG5493770.1 ATP-dependent DNA helicase [Ectothiorhodospira variabilis]MCG5503969.1 ATP-dependent DNA helicase [Ectothiorhodospira variabilis]MCG5507124.1 ATP-dependent DNA helicase [Ectothiorhodospira variabilis]